ncbi:MAG: hypothetical protein ACJ74U_16200 [Jatrophihabitantaceae bacterium]
MIVLAGCGGKAHTATTASALHTNSSVPSSRPPAPVIWTQHQAAHQYLVIVAPSNKLIAQWGALGDGKPLSSYTKLAALLAKSDDQFARSLTAGRWPADVKPKINTLVTTIIHERFAWKAVAAAKTVDQEVAAVNDPALNNNAGPAAADAVRIALGLPSN